MRLKSEMQAAASDLESVVSLMEQMAECISEPQPRWFKVFSRCIETIAEDLDDAAGRLA
jgi:hypothetical protein